MDLDKFIKLEEKMMDMVKYFVPPSADLVLRL